MDVINPKEINRKVITDEMLAGKIFIYPTDTIYGLGCNALNPSSVMKIREIKQRSYKPLSVIAPSKKWILDNCIADIKDLGKLPGPFTLILKLKNKNAVAPEVNMGDTIGVRIPDHWFSSLVKEAGVPFVTTSVNISSRPYITSLEDLPKEIESQVDYFINEGPILGQPSEIIDLTR